MGIFLMCLMCFGFQTYAKDYKPALQAELNSEEARITFDSFVVEDTIQTSFSDPRWFDRRKAAATYDKFAKENNGALSLSELFYVCLSAYNISQGVTWEDCKSIFILPLLKNADELSFIDEEVEEVYNGNIHGMPCTPSETFDSKEIPNMICTTGKHADSDPAFEKAMTTKFRTEGGCKNVGDGNGITCYGVGGKYHPEVYRKNPPFTRAEAEEIAYRDYYTKYNIQRLPDAIRGDVFMALWGSGKAKSSIGLLQQVLGINQTNKIDDETLSAARNYKGNLRKAFLKARWKKMQDNDGFSNGWAKAFIAYLKNGCHTVPKQPLYRTKETTDLCEQHK